MKLSAGDGSGSFLRPHGPLATLDRVDWGTLTAPLLWAVKVPGA